MVKPKDTLTPQADRSPDELERFFQWYNDTALRGINDLVKKGILVKSAASGRS